MVNVIHLHAFDNYLSNSSYRFECNIRWYSLTTWQNSVQERYWWIQLVLYIGWLVRLAELAVGFSRKTTIYLSTWLSYVFVDTTL